MPTVRARGAAPRGLGGAGRPAPRGPSSGAGSCPEGPVSSEPRGQLGALRGPLGWHGGARCQGLCGHHSRHLVVRRGCTGSGHRVCTPPSSHEDGTRGGAKAEQRLRHGQLSEGVTGPAWLRGQLCGAGCVFISMASTLRKVGPCRGGEGGRAAAGAPAQRLPHSGPASLLQRDVTAVEDTQIRRVGPADPVEQSAPQGRGGLCPQLGLPCRVERPRGGGKGGAGFPGGAGAPQAKE